MALTESERNARDAELKQASDDADAGATDINNAIGTVTKGLDETGNAVRQFENLKGQIKAKANAAAGSVGSPSIVGKAAQNIFEFPVFVSSSVPVAYATATNALLEQMYASYLQMAISINPVIQSSEFKKGNIFGHLKTDVSKYLEYATDFYQKDACHNVIEMDNCICEFAMVSLSDNEYQAIQKSLDYEPLSEFAHYFQEAKAPTNPEIRALEREVDALRTEVEVRQTNRGMYTRGQSTQVVNAYDRITRDTEKALRDAERALSAARQEKRSSDREQTEKHERETRAAIEKARAAREEAREAREIERDKREKARDQRDKDLKQAQEERAQAQETRAQAQETRAQNKEKRDIAKDEREKQKDMWQIEKTKMDITHSINRNSVDTKVKAPQFMDETKIQKLNTMKPLMMTVGIKVMGEHGEVSNMIDYVVGVKTHCRVVKSEILPEVVEYPSKAGNLLSRRAKWRAGEIKFMDYLFNRAEKKQAAYDSQTADRRWYHRLYTLAHSKGSSAVAKKVTGKRSREGLIPNVTIIMTKADVDLIEATNGIDLMKGSVAANFCRELFLMSLIVIDTDAESVKILLPDIHNDYEVQSIASINKQLATLDTSNTVSQEVNRLMRGR